jgi:hypothetical protein
MNDGVLGLLVSNMQLRIYLSSTFEDLQKHRESVYSALRALRHDVIAMEDYVAADRRPLDQCLADVRSADVYIGLIAWRYGYVPGAGNPEGRSITELELQEAKRCGKPSLIFILSPKAPWPPAMMDLNTGESEKGGKIARFREALQEGQLAGMFQTGDELAVKVVSAIYRWQMESSAPPVASVPLAMPGEKARARDTFDRLWVPGSRLRVRFLGGNEVLQQRVLRVAQVWTAYANISFEASADEDSEIRVGFQDNMGSWSYMGTQCLEVQHQEPTVNFGWLNAQSPIEEIESVVLHEFGHVLGLMHEHTNPEAHLDWNVENILHDMASPPNSWTKEKVESAVFKSWPRSQFPVAKPFDPKSIMAFSIPGHWTKDGTSLGRNVVLSGPDREFISRLYPYPNERDKSDP